MTILIGAMLIGLTLGMLGSGGSAITVPILIYLVGHGAKESIAESMAIVGLISIAAAIPYAKAHQIDWRSVWYFGIPGMFGTFLGAWLGGIAHEALQLVVFGIVLFAAAYSMLRRVEVSTLTADGECLEFERSPIWKVAIEGILVGILTGFVGVGGGFLIVPALVILGKLPMRLAIGTSLVIIVFKALVGFVKYEHYLVAHDMSVDLQTILIFATVGVLGSIAGRAINTHLDQALLRRVFAGFLILLGGFVVIREGGNLMHNRSASAQQAPAPTEAIIAMSDGEMYPLLQNISLNQSTTPFITD